MRALVIGCVESTRVALEAIRAAGWELAALVTLPLDLAARHSDFVDLESNAKAQGAEVIHAPNSNAPDVIQSIGRLAPDYVFVIGWSQICKPEFLRAADNRVIGYHPAPLPQLRGRAALPWTILLGQTITASTLFWLDQGVDSGPILAQRFLHVAHDETATSLYHRHLVALEAILAEALAALGEGNPARIEQDERYASWTAKRTPADGRIDWDRPADEIWTLIRAVTRPYPGAFTEYKQDKLVLWQAHVWPEAERYAGVPGQVVARKPEGFAVSCGKGALWVSDWQCAATDQPPKLHTVLGRD